MAAVAVLVFDGDCGFCTRSARWLERRARGLEIVAWQRADLAALGLTAQECSSAVRFVGPSGRLSGGAAIAAALQRCRQPYRLAGVVLGAPALQPLVEPAYRAVAARRHRLPGGTPACVTPR